MVKIPLTKKIAVHSRKGERPRQRGGGGGFGIGYRNSKLMRKTKSFKHKKVKKERRQFSR